MNHSSAERAFDSKDETELRVALRRCSDETYEAAREFRLTGSVSAARRAFIGLLERFAERSQRSKLQSPSDELQLSADLGVDSLTLMELVMVAEDVFRVSIPNDDLSGVRTLGDAFTLIEGRLQAQPRNRRHWSGPGGAQMAS